MRLLVHEPHLEDIASHEAFLSKVIKSAGRIGSAVVEFYHGRRLTMIMSSDEALRMGCEAVAPLSLGKTSSSESERVVDTMLLDFPALPKTTTSEKYEKNQGHISLSAMSFDSGHILVAEPISYQS